METNEGKNSYQEIRIFLNDYDMIEKSNDIGVATGNWGCGAFGGDPEVKTIIQWLAASQVILYFQSSIYELEINAYVYTYITKNPTFFFSSLLVNAFFISQKGVFEVC